MKLRSFARSLVVVMAAIALQTAVAEASSHRAPASSVSSVTSSLHEGRYGIGFATSSGITMSSTSLTGWIELGNRVGLQPFFTIPQTSPFQLIGGALVKYTVVERGSSGFHLGGGATLGVVPSGGGSAFGMSIDGIAGFHFPVPGTSNIMVHLDGGPVFGLVDGNSNFALDAISTGLGLSVIYIF